MVPTCIPPGLIPDGLDGFVAGGYAANSYQAGDIDLWIQCQPDELLETRELLLAHLRSVQVPGARFCEEEDWRTHATQDEAYQHMTLNVVRVAKVYHPTTPLPIQIMAVDGGVLSTLEVFDISTHQIALVPRGDGNDIVVKGVHWTPTNVEPVLLREHSKSAARMEKIRKRYAVLRNPRKETRL